MKINAIKNNLFFQGKVNSGSKTPIENNQNQTEVCSKSAASCLASINLPAKKDEIPDLGKIPESIVKKCMTGEKGAIINKETGSLAKISAEIEKGQYDYSVLRIYDDKEEIGYATFKTVTEENPHIHSATDYIGKEGALYIDYMQNNYKGKYSHVGTLMHRLLHELSIQKGHKGKMILDSMTKPAPFHYDSGFVPLASFNADNDYWRAEAQKTELDIVNGKLRGSCLMCLDENKMEQLEAGKHCITQEMKSMDDDTYWEISDKLREIMKNSSPWD